MGNGSPHRAARNRRLPDSAIVAAGTAAADTPFTRMLWDVRGVGVRTSWQIFTMEARAALPDRGLSPRLRAAVDALPLARGMRVLEIGCGPGAAAREVARRVAPGFVLAVDRSAAAVALAERVCASEIAAGQLRVRQGAVERFELDGEQPFDVAFALRVGALDGRHPTAGQVALPRLAAALEPHGRLFIDGGDALREIDLTPYRQRARG